MRTTQLVLLFLVSSLLVVQVVKASGSVEEDGFETFEFEEDDVRTVTDGEAHYNADGDIQFGNGDVLDVDYDSDHNALLSGGGGGGLEGDVKYEKLTALFFSLYGPTNEKGEHVETINQIEALFWRDPAWEITYKEGQFRVMTSSSARVSKGAPGTYEFHYSIQQIEFTDSDAFYLVGFDKVVPRDAVYEEAAFRSVVVTPIDWATCLNDPSNFELLECRQIKYLQGLPCRSQSLGLNYQQECIHFTGRYHQLHDDAANIKPVDLSVQRVINEVNAHGVQTGKFYLECAPKDPLRVYEKRAYGLYDFPKGGYLPRCSVCDRTGICGRNAECRDLGRGDYECVCVPGYEKDVNGECTRSISTPHILLHFNNRESRGYSIIKQCEHYLEEGYDINVGNNPDQSISNYRVNTQYSQELPRPLIEVGEFEVYYTLIDIEGREINKVTRRVVVTPVDRCANSCGVQCPSGTICRWKNFNQDPLALFQYPNDIECVCPQPATCLHPETHEVARKMLRAGYNLQSNHESSCYKETGAGINTNCRDVAAPMMFWREYDEHVYTCRVCDHNFVDGEVSDPDCVFFDFHDQVQKPCAFTRGREKIYVNETFKKEAILLMATDNAGNTITKEIFVYHEIEDVSQHIYELIKFRNQMNDFRDVVLTVWSWFKTILIAAVIILLLWLFTEDGSLFFSALCVKITHPTRSWNAVYADVRVKWMMEDRLRQQERD